MIKINLELDLIQYELLTDILNTAECYLQSDLDVTSKLHEPSIYGNVCIENKARQLCKRLIDCEQLHSEIKLLVKQQAYNKMVDRVQHKKLCTCATK
jgi:hypothetical protein